MQNAIKEQCFLCDPFRDISKGQGYSLVSCVRESVKIGLERVKLKNLHY
jgi:hypothetical protein